MAQGHSYLIPMIFFDILFFFHLSLSLVLPPCPLPHNIFIRFHFWINLSKEKQRAWERENTNGYSTTYGKHMLWKKKKYKFNWHIFILFTFSACKFNFVFHLYWNPRPALGMCFWLQIISTFQYGLEIIGQYDTLAKLRSLRVQQYIQGTVQC